MSYRADEYFFLAPFRGQSLALPFLGFAILGVLTGIFFILSIHEMFFREDKVTNPNDHAE